MLLLAALPRCATRFFETQQPRTNLRSSLLSSAGNRRHESNLVAVFERIAGPKEANIFIVHIDIKEARHFAVLIAQMLFQLGKASSQSVQQIVQSCGRTVKMVESFGMSAKRGGNGYSHVHALASPAGAAIVSRSRYSSNAASLGAIGSGASNLPARASVVFNPLPVMHSTVVSSGRMRFCVYSLRAAPTVTPPAVSVKTPSVSASKVMASTISGSLESSAQPPLLTMAFTA